VQKPLYPFSRRTKLVLAVGLQIEPGLHQYVAVTRDLLCRRDNEDLELAEGLNAATEKSFHRRPPARSSRPLMPAFPRS
jgi:hypothetical protein